MATRLRRGVRQCCRPHPWFHGWATWLPSRCYANSVRLVITSEIWLAAQIFKVSHYRSPAPLDLDAARREAA